MNPYFSIIIPTYNSVKTIANSLESILNQKFNDFEILIMDAVSSDETLTIVQAYNDNRINIFSEKDKGIYDAMNKGIKEAKGNWFYFMGSDDSLHDDKVLNDIYEQVNNSSYDVIYGNVLMMESGVINDGEFDLIKIQTDPICHQAIFYKSIVFKRIGNYDLKYKVYADSDLNLKWFFNSKIKHLYFERIIAKYAETGFSTTTTDEVFYNDLPEKLVKLGWKKIGLNKLKEHSFYASVNNKKNHILIKSILFKLLYYLFRGIDLLKRKLIK